MWDDETGLSPPSWKQPVASIPIRYEPLPRLPKYIFEIRFSVLKIYLKMFKCFQSVFNTKWLKEESKNLLVASVAQMPPWI